jgi:hypothetical protein
MHDFESVSLLSEWHMSEFVVCLRDEKRRLLLCKEQLCHKSGKMKKNKKKSITIVDSGIQITI